MERKKGRKQKYFTGYCSQIIIKKKGKKGKIINNAYELDIDN